MERKESYLLRLKNGMSTLPSDVSSPDEALTAEVGMIYEDGEHRVIQSPVAVTSALSYDALYIHDFANYTHLIGVIESGGVRNLYFSESPFSLVSEDKKLIALSAGLTLGDIRTVSSVGNTLIVSTDAGILYFLWKPSETSESYPNGKYVCLGSKLPDIDADYSVTEADDYLTNERAVVTGFVEHYNNDDPYSTYIVSEYKTSFMDAINGHVATVQQEIKKKGWFLYPFWVRLAWQMYDGQNTMLTNPILVLACVRSNQFVCGCKYNEHSLLRELVYYPHAARLSFRINNTDLADWKDIISGVDVYLSEQVCPFDFGDWTFRNEAEDTEYTPEWGVDVWSSLLSPSVGAAAEYQMHTTSAERRRLYDKMYNSESQTCPIEHGWANLVVPNDTLGDKEIMHRLIDKSQFYRVCDVPYSAIDHSWHYVDELMRKDTLVTLTSQHQLAHDDYYNHCNISAESLFVYNGRLHLGDVSRGFYEGYNHFLVGGRVVDTATTAGSTECEGVYVTIDTNEGEKVVYREMSKPLTELLGYWFYYPDPRAKSVTYVMGNDYRLTYNLTRHEWLNGAYYFLALPTTDAHNTSASSFSEYVIGGDEDPSESTDNDGFEQLDNQLLVSEVSNPFLFTVDGAEEIGSGKILGLCANTEAVSEGQFGAFPLYAFTSEGIWALSVSSEGLYDTIRPISREVCNNARSITQTDNSVFFTSEKGLMRIAGSQVSSMSAPMMGAMFDVTALGSGETITTLSGVPSLHEYISDEDMRIVYDYKQSRLWLYRTDMDWVYVFSMKTTAFALYKLTSRIKSSHILYPDFWLQSADGRMLSMAQVKHMSEDTNTYSSVMLTRPLSLGTPFMYKQIQQIEHLMTKDSSSLTLRLFGSNNTREWAEIKVLRGRPWKYYRMLIEISGLSATDAYSGMMIQAEVRRSHRLHPEDGHGSTTEETRPISQ